jgi:transcriptional regulator with XRE-family HTH domain
VGAYVDPGDLGRRLAYRRRQLGLSREQVAERAGVHPSYLAYLEESPAAPTTGAVVRLAGALETTPQALIGGGLERPPGPGGRASHSRLVELDEAECWRLVEPGGVGRVAVNTIDGPVVLPVNFVVLSRSIVFRTAPSTVPATHVGELVAVEVDRVDSALRSGWSVLLSGRSEQLDVGQLGSDVPIVQPWAGGVRDLYLRVRVVRVTGRRIVPG